MLIILEDRFDVVLGRGRGTSETPWERMGASAQEQASASAAWQFITEVVHDDGGDYTPDTEGLQRRLREFAESWRRLRLTGAELTEAVSLWVTETPELNAQLHELSRELARDLYSQ